MYPMYLPSLDLPPLALLALGWLVLVNAGTYALVGIDRARAAARRSRASETALLWLAAIGGWPGLKLALRRSPGLRFSFAFRGWINGAIAAQVLLAFMALLPRGSILVATETVAAAFFEDVWAAEGRAKTNRIVMDSEHSGPRLANVVQLSSD